MRPMHASFLLTALAWGSISAARGTADPNHQKDMMNIAKFRRDVIDRAQQPSDRSDRNFRVGRDGTGSVESLLLKKAIPLAEYEAKTTAAGGDPFSAKLDAKIATRLEPPAFMRVETGRHLEDGVAEGDDDGNAEDEEAANDDEQSYYDNNAYDFQGYSLKYVKCQKVQRFSTEAVLNGEYSAMVTDDIVVLRLCPQRRCSYKETYGCSSGYGEYVIGVSDYMSIIMKHQVDMQKNLCTFCAECAAGRRMENNQDGQNDQEGNNQNENNNKDGNQNNDQNQNQDNNNQDQDGADDNGNGEDAAGDDDGNTNDGGSQTDGYYYNVSGTNSSYYEYDENPCNTYADLCENYDNWCDSDGDDGRNDDKSFGYENYLDYFGCVKVNSQYNKGGYYWVSPYCSSSKGTITMGIFGDPYCSQYVGKEVNVNDFSGINFDNSVFARAYSTTCYNCATSEYPPYYNANNYLCNNVYEMSGKCNTNLAYDLGDQNDDDASQGSSVEVSSCAFLEGIRDGFYDKNGNIYVSSLQKKYSISSVSIGQKLSLIMLTLICIGLGVYSCYLHHEFTNLLLKSLSVGLVQNRGRSRSKSRRGSRSRSTKKSKSSKKNLTSDDDWD